MFKVNDWKHYNKVRNMFKVYNKDTRTTPMTSSGVFIVKFEHISHPALVLPAQLMVVFCESKRQGCAVKLWLNLTLNCDSKAIKILFIIYFSERTGEKYKRKNSDSDITFK